MADPVHLLRLQQWLSPAFPIGGFAFSHGLEAVVLAGDITDVSSTGAWVRAVLAHGAGFSDAVLLIAARRGRSVEDLTDIAAALAPSQERWLETTELGAAFVRVARETGEAAERAPLPIAVGQVTRALDLDDATVAASYLQSMSATLIAAAVRFVPLGQSEGQRLQADLANLCVDTAARAVQTAPEDIYGFVPAADLASMAHETQDVRIFKT
ncbi:MAG: urease accessory UreF family protein [Pseudomonadota bacterium]